MLMDANNINKLLRKLDIYNTERNRRYFFIVLCCIFLLYFVFIKAPSDFPEKTLLYIEEGNTLEEVSNELKDKQIIRSEFLFKTLAVLFEGDRGARWGDYYFDRAQNVFTVARRITKGSFGLTPTKVTLHEGLSVVEMAQISEDLFENIKKEDFIEIALDKEGYLFPDTYLFLPNVTSEQVIDTMLENFSNKMEEIGNILKISEISLEDTVIMASILEKEAITLEDKKIVSGILWKRIEIGMPLQVDAVFLYINGKNTFELTLDDLQIDSPYNTYKYKGLPPSPISNPGLDSIIAALLPEKSPYLYYLSDLDSVIHYAETFEEHKRNKNLYLK